MFLGPGHASNPFWPRITNVRPGFGSRNPRLCCRLLTSPHSKIRPDQSNMSNLFLPRVSVCIVVLLSILGRGQSAKPVTPAPTVKPFDDSKEAVIIERYATRVVYEADGSGTREIAAVIHVQAGAGGQAFGALPFPYTSDDESVEVGYVRVKKPDGTIVVTPNYNIQDLPAEIT